MTEADEAMEAWPPSKESDTESLTCEFCRYRFPERLGRYGCPNCEGEGLD